MNTETVIIGKKGSPTKRVRLHIRVSTKSQTEVQHGSPEQQRNAALRKIEEQCRKDSFCRVVEIVSEAISGKGWIPLVDEEIRKTKAEVRKLETIVNRFSESLRKSALTGEGDLSEICKELMAEKQKAEVELEDARLRLQESQAKKEEIKKRFEGSTAQDWLERVFSKFDGEIDLKKKRLVQAIVPEVILHENQKLELRINPDPAGNVDSSWASLAAQSGGRILGIDEKWRAK